jgi:hypothetical protein
MTNIISCSIPADLADFIKDNKNVKPSKVLQDGLYRIRDEENKIKARIIQLEREKSDDRRQILALWAFIKSRDMVVQAKEFINNQDVVE